MKKIALASNNQGKIKEISRILEPYEVEILHQADFTSEEAEETGLTFVENAILKARFLADISGLPVIADDSGLEVDALQGAPGIYSARYAGENASDRDNLSKLLDNMQTVEQGKRSARFQCVLVYLRHALDPVPIIAEGSWEGSILSEAEGDNGFGYDPVFFVTSEQKSAALLSAADKNRISHRGLALQILLKKLHGCF